MSEDEALEWLEETLTEGAKPKLTPAERKAPLRPKKPPRLPSHGCEAPPQPRPRRRRREEDGRCGKNATAKKPGRDGRPRVAK